MANLPDASDPRHLRASDTDRERVASALREAANEGRLSLHELDERLAAAYEARTYAELQPLVSDLPQPAYVSHANEKTFDEIAIGSTPKMSVAFMSGFRKAGSWAVGRVYSVFAFMGGGKIDLREARFLEGEVTIRVFALMGGAEIIVPEGVHVHVGGFAFMGGFGDHSRAKEPVPANAPRVHVTGFVMMGGVDVKRRAPRGEKD